MGLTLFYGLVIAMPAAALIAFTWPRLAFVKKRMNPSVPLSLISDRDLPEGNCRHSGPACSSRWFASC